MNCRLLATHGDEFVLGEGAHRHGVEAPEPTSKCVRTGEGSLERNLLIEQHADQQRGGVGIEEPIGVGVVGDVEITTHAGS